MAVQRDPQDWEEPQDEARQAGQRPQAPQSDEPEPERSRSESAFRREPRLEPGTRFDYPPERAEPEPARPPLLGPASIVALFFGIAYVAIGAIALSRGGFDELNLHHTVMGIAHTPLLGLMELVYGALLLIAAALNPPWGRNLIGALGIVAVGFGLLVVFFQQALSPALGVTMTNGLLYIVTGGVILLAAVASAALVDRGRSVTYNR